MNRSYSRFVPNGSRFVSASRKGTVVRAKKRRSGKAYWFPIVTMIAAVFFAASAVMPRSLFDAFAAGSYSMTVNSGAGEYTVKVTGDTESVTVDSDTIAVPSLSGDDVVLAITLTESTSFTITSTEPMTTVEFGEGSSVVNSINVGNSGTTTLNISKTGISSLDLSGNNDLSDAAYEITAPSSGITFKLAAPEFTGSDGEGVAFDVPGAYCEDQFENLTATMPDNAEITKKDGKFFRDENAIREIRKRLLYLAYKTGKDNWKETFEEYDNRLKAADISQCERIAYSFNDNIETDLMVYAEDEKALWYVNSWTGPMFLEVLNWIENKIGLKGSFDNNFMRKLFLTPFKDFVRRQEGGSLPQEILDFLSEEEKAGIQVDKFANAEKFEEKTFDEIDDDIDEDEEELDMNEEDESELMDEEGAESLSSSTSHSEPRPSRSTSPRERSQKPSSSSTGSGKSEKEPTIPSRPDAPQLPQKSTENKPDAHQQCSIGANSWTFLWWWRLSRTQWKRWRNVSHVKGFSDTYPKEY